MINDYSYVFSEAWSYDVDEGLGHNSVFHLGGRGERVGCARLTASEGLLSTVCCRT